MHKSYFESLIIDYVVEFYLVLKGSEETVMNDVLY